MLPITSVPSSLSTVGLLALSTTLSSTCVVTVGESLHQVEEARGSSPEVHPAGVQAGVSSLHHVHA